MCVHPPVPCLAWFSFQDARTRRRSASAGTPVGKRTLPMSGGGHVPFTVPAAPGTFVVPPSAGSAGAVSAQGDNASTGSGTSGYSSTLSSQAVLTASVAAAGAGAADHGGGGMMTRLMRSVSAVALPSSPATGTAAAGVQAMRAAPVTAQHSVGGNAGAAPVQPGEASELALRSQSTLAALLRPGGANDGKFGGRQAILALPDSNFEPPTPTFPWRKGEMVGAGQSGRVFKALRMDTGKLMAVKVRNGCCVEHVWVDRGGGRGESPVALRHGWAQVIETSSKRQQQLLEREVMVMKLLKHPNIVRYLGSESGVTDLCPVVNVFMEYCHGGSIHALLKRYGPLSEPVIQVGARHLPQ